MTAYEMTAAAHDDSPLPCPHCGYDLRGNATGVCPECGKPFDAGTLQAAAPLPWNDRRRIGLFRAFARQAWQAIRRPRELADLVGRPVDFRAARRFQLLCALVGGVGLGPLLAYGFLKLRPAVLAAMDVIWSSPPPSTAPPPDDLLLDGLILLAVLIGGLLWLFAVSGVASYFFHPRDEPVSHQNSALALSRMVAAAPLVLLPLVAVFLGIYLVLHRDGIILGGSAALTVVSGAGLALSAVTLLIIALLLLRGPWVVLRRGLGRSRRRAVVMALTTLLAWPLLFVLLVIGLPLLTWWAESVVLMLFG